MADILRVIQDRGKARVTHILYGANLSYDRLKKYLNELISRGLIQERIEEGITYYSITKKGIDFLKEYERIRKLCEAFGISI